LSIIDKPTGYSGSDDVARADLPPVRGLRATLTAGLFPAAETTSPSRRTWLLLAVLEVAALAAGAGLLLLRDPGIPPWRSVYAEDGGIFLVEALQRPWDVLIPYAGYLEFMPRLIAQFALLAPLRNAPVVFALAGSVIASGCGLFTFHASAGHVRSRTLRALLAIAVVLLSVAPLEITDSGVNTPWYLLYALFWAIVWRPKSRAGAALAAVVAFAAASSVPLAAFLAPLVLLRIVALPRVREHAVTAGWAAGCLLQVPVMLASHTSRVSHLAAPGKTLAYYAHSVVLPVFGWHLSWHLSALLGRGGATAAVGAAAVLALGTLAVTQGRRYQVFAVVAVLTGLVLNVGAATINSAVPGFPITPYYEHGARYSVVPILLLQAALIAGADAWTRLRGRNRQVPGSQRGPGSLRVPVSRLRARAVAGALAAVLAVGWVTDFRYATARTNVAAWAPTATTWVRACEHAATGTITEWTGVWEGRTGWSVIPCANVRR
jgi:hypothetical protein